MDSSNITDGVLLVGHGTRDAEGMAEVRELVGKVAIRAAPRAVEVGFIELAEPTIAQACERLVERGVRQIRVVPLLLFSAGHAKFDVPGALRDAAARHPGLEFSIADPLGLDAPIVALSQRRFDEALTARAAVPIAETYWLIVGRGSSDPDATHGLEQLARRRHERLGTANSSWCFVAAARPTLDEGLEIAAESRLKRIVVQPHLLFRGLVMKEIRTAVAHWQARESDVEWIVTAHLGPAQEVVEAVAARIDGCMLDYLRAPMPE
jgi:sirohydrochlorin ferrochelatase